MTTKQLSATKAAKNSYENSRQSINADEAKELRSNTLIELRAQGRSNLFIRRAMKLRCSYN